MASKTVNQRATSPRGALSPAEHRKMNKLWKDFLATEPLIKDNEEMMKFESVVQSDEVLRRMLLASMKFGGADLYEKSKDEDGAKVLAMAIIAGERWINRTKELIKLADMQILRLQFSLRDKEDPDALMKMADVEMFD